MHAPTNTCIHIDPGVHSEGKHIILLYLSNYSRRDSLMSDVYVVDKRLKQHRILIEQRVDFSLVQQY
jgi:hypothetical protein